MCIRDRITTILLSYQNLSIHLLDVDDENIVMQTKSQKNRKKVLLDVWAYQQNVIERPLVVLNEPSIMTRSFVVELECLKTAW